MMLIATLTNKAGKKYNFYVAYVQGKALYNLLPQGADTSSDSGYFNIAYLFRIKGF